MGHKINIQNNNTNLQSILNMINALGLSGLATVVEAPRQMGSLHYNGKVQYPEWEGYDTNQFTIGGTTSATEVGTYTATFTPKSGYAWADGSTSAKSINWTISN